MSKSKLPYHIICILLAVCFFVPYVLYMVNASRNYQSNQTQLSEQMPDFNNSLMDMSTKDNVDIQSLAYYSSDNTIVLNDASYTGTTCDYDVYTTYGDYNVRTRELLGYTGTIADINYLADAIVAQAKYEDNVLSEIVTDSDTVSYMYDDDRVVGVTSNFGTFDYEYVGGKLATITRDEQPITTIQYDTNGNVSVEKYAQLGRAFSYHTDHVMEHLYSPYNDALIKYDRVERDNTLYYQWTTRSKRLGDNIFTVVNSVTYNDQTVTFDYNYQYNGQPYVTNIVTPTDTINLHYVMDKVVVEKHNDYIVNYVYSSGALTGFVYITNSESAPVMYNCALVTDASANVISASALVDVEGELLPRQIFNRQYSAIGRPIDNAQSAFNFLLGYQSCLQLADMQLVLNQGSVYSTLTGEYLLWHDALKPAYTSSVTTHESVMTSTYEHALATYNVQTALYDTFGVTSSDYAPMYIGNTLREVADIFTIPSTVDTDNFGKHSEQVYVVVDATNTAEVDYYTQLFSTAMSDKTSCVSWGSLYPLITGCDNTVAQYIYNGKLYKVTLTAGGIYTYKAYDNISANYEPNTNLVDFNRGKYVQYFKSDIVATDYYDNVSIIVGIQGVDDATDYLVSSGYITESITELTAGCDTITDSERMTRALTNMFELNLPEYDPVTQYLTVDEQGNIVAQDMPDEMETMQEPRKFNLSQLIQGLMYVGSGIGIFVQGVMLLACCTPFGIVMGVIGAVAGLTAVVCGLVLVENTLNPDNPNNPINAWFGGDPTILCNIANIALTVGTIATTLGNAFGKACFVANTAVTTLSGATVIQSVRPGDYVLSYNADTGTTEYKQVVDVYKKSTTTLVDVCYNNTVTTCTPEHPFYVGGKWVSAGELHAGNILTLDDGTTAVVTSTRTYSVLPTDVYNLQVEDNHNYYANDALVHNTCDKLANYTNNEIKDSPEFKKAVDTVTKKYGIGKGQSRVSWNTVRKEMWKEFYQNCKATNNNGLMNKISNFDLLRKGKAPIIGGQRLQLHHVVSKANDMFNVVPMTPPKHTLFHQTYGYHFDKPIIPWITK